MASAIWAEPSLFMTATVPDPLPPIQKIRSPSRTKWSRTCASVSISVSRAMPSAPPQATKTGTRRIRAVGSSLPGRTVVNYGRIAVTWESRAVAHGPRDDVVRVASVAGAGAEAEVGPRAGDRRDVDPVRQQRCRRLARRGGEIDVERGGRGVVIDPRIHGLAAVDGQRRIRRGQVRLDVSVAEHGEVGVRRVVRVPDGVELDGDAGRDAGVAEPAAPGAQRGRAAGVVLPVEGEPVP